MFGCTIVFLLFQHGNRLILEQVFFHLEQALYRSTGDSLRSMPANVIEFIFLASLDYVLLFKSLQPAMVDFRSSF